MKVPLGQYPDPTHVVAHLSDPHLLAAGQLQYGVVDPEAGVAPGAQVPGYRVAGKTGTAQRANAECGCYDGTFTVSLSLIHI